MLLTPVHDLSLLKPHLETDLLRSLRLTILDTFNFELTLRSGIKKI